MPEEFDAGTRKAKNIMDSFIEALYGQSEETIPEEYDWFAPLLGDWEFDYKDKFIVKRRVDLQTGIERDRY